MIKRKKLSQSLPNVLARLHVKQIVLHMRCSRSRDGLTQHYVTHKFVDELHTLK